MWKYYNPVEVVFGTGKLDELGQLMAERGLDRALIVSDPFTHRSGVAARLKECAGGRVLDIISEVEPNPNCDNVDACARRARELGAGPSSAWAAAPPWTAPRPRRLRPPWTAPAWSCCGGGPSPMRCPSLPCQPPPEPAARWAGARCSPTTPPTPKSPFSAVPCSPGWPWWTRC